MEGEPRRAPTPPVSVFLCGDVMTGRGVDQVLPHPSDPRLYEPFVQDARDYVALAETANGPIAAPLGYGDIWGDALDELERLRPDVRIINLETSITRSDDYWPDKGINYRMHPDNVGCLTAARIDVCALANNHVLDWGYAGLEETIETLRRAGVRTVGAGRDIAEARDPAVIDVAGKGRVVVLALGSESSGVPPSWAATEERPGIDFLGDLRDGTARDVEDRVRRVKRSSDIVVASIHWGSNWGYDVAPEFVHFAHRLVEAGVDVVHGHSSHHPRPIEVYRNRLILYGCGDFLNDYEGISGYERFRGDRTLMYFATLATGGELLGLHMTPMIIRNLRLRRAPAHDASWLADTLDGISAPFGSQVRLEEDGRLRLHWLASRKR